MSNEFEPWFANTQSSEFENWDWSSSAHPQQADAEDQNPEVDFTIECERVRDEAREKGYQEGLAKAREEDAERQNELLQWLEFIRNPAQLLDEELSNELVHTLLWLCQHCIHIELSVQPEKLLALIEDLKPSLASLQNDKQVVMNPQDVEWLNNNLGGKNKTIADLLVADETLARGDFYLRSNDSELDGTLKTRVQNLFNKHLPACCVDFDKEDQQ